MIFYISHYIARCTDRQSTEIDSVRVADLRLADPKTQKRVICGRFADSQALTAPAIEQSRPGARVRCAGGPFHGHPDIHPDTSILDVA